MSKLYELLAAAAKGSDRKNEKFKSVTLTVFADGTAHVSMNGKWIAAGADEAELIAKLAQRAAAEVEKV